MGLLLALCLSAGESLPGPAPEPPLRPLRWAVTLGPGFAHDIEGGTALWGGAEVSLQVIRLLRFELSSSAAWVPFPLTRYPGANGPTRAAFRVVAGADILVPFRWGQLFVGAAGGVEHTNLIYEVFGADEDPRDRVRFLWFTRWCVLARGGVDVRMSRHVALGASLNAVLVQYLILGGEVQGRISILF